MNIFRILFLFLLLPFLSGAQAYRPIQRAGASWQFVEYNTGSLNAAYWNYYYLRTDSLFPDTVIGNQVYHQLLRAATTLAYFGGYRSDSTGKSWWIPAQDSVEHLLMDLDVLPGDTLTSVFVQNPFSTQNPTYVVIDSVGVFWSGTVPLKLVYCSYETGFSFREPLLWIESFGSMQGFVNQIFDGWSRWLPLCISSDSVRYEQVCQLCAVDSTFSRPQFYAPVAGSCVLFSALLTGVAESYAPGFGYFPNPAVDQLTVEPTSAAPALFRLYNASGQLVRTCRIVGRTVIDVADLPAGLYLAELETPKGNARRKVLLAR